jgi:hypothetical protein
MGVRIHSPIFQPVVSLVLWTMFMWVWMYATRLPAMAAARIDSFKLVGGTGASLQNLLPPTVMWKADNYNHLLAEPTLFYVICIVLALEGAGDGFNLQMAWIYVGFRVLHSLIQATINRVWLRFTLFVMSSLTLIYLSFAAAQLVFEFQLFEV